MTRARPRFRVPTCAKVLSLGLLLTCAASLAQAGTRRALLVGVADYHPSVQAIAPPLEGTVNDVALMWTLLREAEVPPERITLLTDAGPLLPPAALQIRQRPTRAAILSALDRLADTVASDDTVLIYFAGHGSQLAAPATSHEEPDGLDEVFLPADFAIDMSGAVPRYTNPVRDNEIGARIDRMIRRGAHVWLVADTCHAGSLRRGDPVTLVPRQLTLWHIAASTNTPEVFIPSPRDGLGRFVAFYAAPAGALAYETRVPGSADGEGRVHGLLTWALAEAVRHGAQDYRALSQAVSARVWEISAGHAVPEFAGALATPPMIGADALSGRRFPVVFVEGGLRVAAGRLDGMREGTLLAIGWSGSTRRDSALAIARITKAGLAAAALELPPTGHAGAEGLDRELRDARLDPDRYRSRWLEDRAQALVAWPLDAREASARTGNATSNTAAPEGENATPRSPQALRDLAEELRDSPISRALETGLRILPRDHEVCPSAQPRRKPDRRTVDHCDVVEVTLHNTGPQTLDITPLYLAPDGGVYFLSGFAGAQSGGLRLAPGETDHVRYREDTAPRAGVPAATGEVTLLFLAVPGAEGDEPPVDFRYLQNPDSFILRSSVTELPASASLHAGAQVLTVVTRPPDPDEDDSH